MGFLIVRAGGQRYGLGINRVTEVIDGFAVDRVPSVHPSVRGVTPVRDRLVPLVHLGSLVSGTPPPELQGDTIVVAECSGKTVAFEVDDADEVVFEDPLPVPDGWDLPWALGVAKRDEELIPVVDVATLVDRLTTASIEEQT